MWNHLISIETFWDQIVFGIMLMDTGVHGYMSVLSLNVTCWLDLCISVMFSAEKLCFIVIEKSAVA